VNPEEVESLEASFDHHTNTLDADESEAVPTVIAKTTLEPAKPHHRSKKPAGGVTATSSRTSSSSSSPSRSHSDESHTNILETQFTDTKQRLSANSIINDLVKYKKKSLLNIQNSTTATSSASPHRKHQRHKSNTTNESGNGGGTGGANSHRDDEPGRMCCTRRCTCVFLIILYVVFDVLVNLFFVTRAFSELPDVRPAAYRIESSLVDVWAVSLVRDSFTLIVVIISAVRSRVIYGFVRVVHKKYVSSFLCLIMYAYAMIKMLLHADQRTADRNSMLMFVWNIGASVAFFLCVYMLALLKPKECRYQKTNVDGGDMSEENAGDEGDIFIETLKETNKKRSSLARLFSYSLPDLHVILCGSLFLLLGAICKFRLMRKKESIGEKRTKICLM
jgi:hypothetical protein